MPGSSNFSILNDPARNKSTAFTPEERELHGLRGLLPSSVDSQETQIMRALANMRRKEYDIEKYIFLLGLQRSNERLFYQTLIQHVDELLPLVYTPTVGQACREFGRIFREPRGFYVSPDDRGSLRTILRNWPHDDVRLIVLTDGERILGLGDLGANGIGIPIGKLSLYVAFAGIQPEQCMPVQIDVGTNNRELRDDPLYLGWPHGRLRGEGYLELMDEFVEAAAEVFPKALIQFEDFLTPNAYTLLDRYRDRFRCFNDDIQGTAAVALAGIQAAIRTTKDPFRDLRVLFVGAGAAATGVAALTRRALLAEGLTPDEARQRLWFVDLDGLVVRTRDHIEAYSEPYAQDQPAMGLPEAIRTLKPHVLLGATGSPGAFDEQVIRTMAEVRERPIVFAMSNPTTSSECTAREAYTWSDGRAIFASGSPFPPVTLDDGTVRRPAQANNAYAFPGIGLGVVGSGARTVTDEMFLLAARALSDQVSEQDLAEGAVYPKLSRIREVSLGIAEAVARHAWDSGMTDQGRPDDIREELRGMMYEPGY